MQVDSGSHGPLAIIDVDGLKQWKEQAMSAATYVKLRKLAAVVNEETNDIVQHAIDQLGGMQEKAVIQLRLIGTEETAPPTIYTVQVSPARVFLTDNTVAKPTLAIITTLDVFRRMADADYSPISAYQDGKLRLRGDVGLARRMLRKLAEPSIEEAPFPCLPTLQNESYQDEALTFSGIYFTPGGEVEIVYDWGGGFYQQIVVAGG
jgi:SCP-2 sterol transfer family